MTTSAHLLVKNLIGFAALLCVCPMAIAQTNNSYPMLMSIKPAATVVGQTTEHELSARYNLAGGNGVIISGTGVRGEVVPLETEKSEDKDRNDITSSKCKLRITCDADALPGIRDFRVWTPHGVSTVGQIVVGREVLVNEVPDNDTLDKAQNATLPAMICGTIEKGEDIDLYKLRIEQPGAWTFHMTSQRLQNRLHDMQIRVDPMITLKSAIGSTIASSDNTFAGDPLMHVKIDTPGEYILEVRDARYQGNVDWTYAIECSARPFAMVARPLAIRSDGTAPVEIVGLGMPADAMATVTLPASDRTRVERFAPVIAGVPLNTSQVVSTPDPIVCEASGDKPATETQTPSFTIPSMLCGCVDEPEQVDRYRFEAKAQQRFTFEVFARRLGSNLDAKLRILNGDGNPLSEADDSTFERVLSSDASLENWTSPADGIYTVEVRDLHGRGGKDFPYALHVTQAKPYFLLEADTDKTPLAVGGASVIYVRAQRRNGFTGEIQLAVEGLPPGVRAEAGRILPSRPDGAIWLTAAADAPHGMANIHIFGSSEHAEADGSKTPLQSRASCLQEIYMPGGGRGHYPVDQHTVSVAKPMDIRNIKLSANHIELKPGSSQRIDIEVERAPDYKGNVTLDAMLQHLEQPYGNPLPAGVSVDIGASKTLLTAGESAGYITFKANPDAPLVDRHLVPITVHVSINFVMKHTFSSEPFFITVKSAP
ncbi:MAG: pre-peptidase C-terminal domain-containing protein [Planctomycetes bacterium]|nr:pre-peptidase C-terminal domain-containing protein [Planctomycetota bacterium]